MNIPGFTVQASLYRSIQRYGAWSADSSDAAKHGQDTRATWDGRPASGIVGQPGAALRPALNIPSPIDICLRFPELCQLAPSINVSWLTCNNGLTGYVVVTGNNFAAHSGVQVEVGNCSGPFTVPVGATADANGSFTTWVSCDCSGSTTVTAIDSAGNSAQGSAAMPC